MTPDKKARLILRALSGNHLYGFLPGNDHKNAISHAVGTHHEWSGPEECGRVTKRGIETFDSLDVMYGGQLVRSGWLILWSDVLDVVARGCTDGRREAYETAFAAWNGHHRRFEFRYWDLEECKRRRNRTDEEIQAETALRTSAGCDPFMLLISAVG